MSFISRRIISKNSNQFNWNIAELPLNTNVTSVTFGEEKFVATGSGALYSDDGINWTETTFPATNSAAAVAFGQGKFVAVCGDGSAAYSDDGIIWTQTIPPNQYPKYSIAASPARFVCSPIALVGESRIIYSNNGINWQNGSLLPEYYWNSVSYANGLFFAVGRRRSPSPIGNIIAYSSNGINWSTTELTSPSEDIEYSLKAVAYGNGKFVTIGSRSNDSISLISNDGINWSSPNYLPQNGVDDYSDIIYANGMFVTYGQVGFTYSIDGINFFPNPLPLSRAWKSITYGKNRFVLVGGGSKSLYTS